jgi:predicted nuclease of predicted toxin-antitoxin system
MHNLKFLLDADMPRSSAEVIRSIGFDVEDVRDIGLRYAKDKEIIEYALKNKRVIITRDTDFGEVLRYPNHPGAIIFRLPYTFTANEINKRLEEFFKSVKEEELKETITIVELSRYRRRSLRDD